MSRSRILPSGLALLFALAGLAYSQTTYATITGTVTDATGAIVPRATVSATNIATNIKTTTQSNEAGNFTLPQLLEGTYTVRAEAAGFKSVVVDKVLLAARDVRRVDIRLEVGTVETAVEVSGGATLIETETARIADNKDSAVLNTLPTNSRGLWAYLSLSPGLQGQSGSSVTRFAGSRVNENNWSIDGTSFSDGVDNTQTGPLANYIESFQEVHVDLANNSAEFPSIGQVTIISKSGTNELHGSVFDYYSTPWFRAKSVFASQRPTGITHLPGFDIGGPVYIPKVYDGRNRSFFYFSYETARGSATQQNLTPTVAPAAWRTGDLSSFAGQITDPFNNNAPFPGNRIPADRINPVSKLIQDKFWPVPNYGDLATLHSQNYRELKIRSYDPSTYWTVRGDQHFSSADQVFGRYTWSRLYNRPWEGSLPTIGQRWQQRDDRAATVSWTHSFGPAVLNEVRYGMHRNNNPINYDLSLGSTQHGLDIVKTLGLVGLAPNLPDINGILNISFSNGITGLNQYPSRTKGYRTHTEEIQERLSWFRGRHGVKAGVNVLRAEYDSSGTDNNLFGNVRFTDRFTGQPYADFLLGVPTTASRSFPPIESDRNRWSYDFFLVDDWKVNSKLTLNLGVRYELHFNWRENNNLVSLFDVGSGTIVVPNGAASKISPIFPKNYVGISEASSVGFDSRSLARQNLHNVAPRIGVAYRPWGNDTVFRAGWGIFYNVVPFVYALNFAGVPFNLSEPSFNNPKDNPQVIFPRVFPASGTGGPSNVGLPPAQNPDLKTSYSMQYNFTIERQQWNTGFRASYIGTAQRRGVYQYNYNAPVASTELYINKPRPFPKFPDIYYVTNGSGHQYNALTLEAQRRLAGGLYFQSSWTWARDIYDLDYNWDFETPQYTLEDPRNRRREIGPAQDIPTHRFSTNFIYQLPFGRGRKFGSSISRLGNLLIGGWEITGIYTVQSGMFLTPYWTGDDPANIYYTSSASPATVTIRPDILKNPNTGTKSLERWFDTSAFAPPAPGRFGTSARGVIIGPGVNVWSAGFAKEFSFSERVRLRWDLTANNFFNHPNWQNPGTDLSDTTGFGVITSDGGVTGDSIGDRPGPRAFRMGPRLRF